MQNLLDYLLLLAALAASWQVHAAFTRSERLSEGTGLEEIGSSGKGEPEKRQPWPADLEGRFAAVFGPEGPADFIAGAKRAYELILAAFTAGDLGPVSFLLGENLNRTFAQILAERRAKGESFTNHFIGFVSAEPVDAGRERDHVWVEVRFVTQMVSERRDSAGALVEGDPHRVGETAELWTFSRPIKSRDPNWLLVATGPDE
ncbi:Tim44/TimA family putative adaptor protein [Devosia honganensis]|uniref:Tim44/TimA family putative adaptor protein n=1 Tax=Devosia honganensis TaxID=1610527 RepID=A0ABV7WZ11_9HYPH